MRPPDARTISLCCIVAATVALTALYAPPAHAQVFRTGRDDGDRATVRGGVQLWRAELGGTFADLEEELVSTPIDVVDSLGLEEEQDGILADVHLTLGKRHRLIGVFSQQEHSAAGVELSERIRIGGREFLLNEIVDTRIDFREGHAFYNFLVVARQQAEAGLLVGGGALELEGEISSNLGNVLTTFNSPVPLIGGNLRVNPGGRVGVYAEVNGFPEVEIEGFSGEILDWQVRAEAYPLENLAVLVGYRSYRLTFSEIETLEVNLDWKGLTFGGMLRF